MRRSDPIRLAAQALACTAILLGVIPATAQDRPTRVVSVNLCTDQLALMLAEAGQLISVSRLSHDPQSSAMVDAARDLPTNGSTAEEVYLLNPDLVLAGTFTSGATVEMLRGLGIQVELFAPATSIADVPLRLQQMGAVLGREAEANRLIDRFNRDLSDLSDAPARRPRAALSYVNNYTSGDKTLAGDILRLAGFDNVAGEAGLEAGGMLSLEQLVLLAPEVIIQGRTYSGHARAEDNLKHPALRALPDTQLASGMTDRDWICGTPQVLAAIAPLRRLRQSMSDTP